MSHAATCTTTLPRATSRPSRFLSARVLLDWVALHRQRRALSRLDAHLLCDVGLTPDAATREAARPVWDVPANWRAGR